MYEQDLFVQFRSFGRKKYLIKRNEYFELDLVGQFIWFLIDGKHSIEDISKQIAMEFKISVEQAHSDLVPFINELLESQLIIHVMDK